MYTMMPRTSSSRGPSSTSPSSESSGWERISAPGHQSLPVAPDPLSSDDASSCGYSDVPYSDVPASGESESIEDEDQPDTTPVLSHPETSNDRCSSPGDQAESNLSRELHEPWPTTSTGGWFESVGDDHVLSNLAIAPDLTQDPFDLSSHDPNAVFTFRHVPNYDSSSQSDDSTSYQTRSTYFRRQTRFERQDYIAREMDPRTWQSREMREVSSSLMELRTTFQGLQDAITHLSTRLDKMDNLAEELAAERKGKQIQSDSSDLPFLFCEQFSAQLKALNNPFQQTLKTTSTSAESTSLAPPRAAAPKVATEDQEKAPETQARTTTTGSQVPGHDDTSTPGASPNEETVKSTPESTSTAPTTAAVENITPPSKDSTEEVDVSHKAKEWSLKRAVASNWTVTVLPSFLLLDDEADWITKLKIPLLLLLLFFTSDFLLWQVQKWQNTPRREQTMTEEESSVPFLVFSILFTWVATFGCGMIFKAIYSSEGWC